MVVMESTEMQHRMPAWYDRYETTTGETIKQVNETLYGLFANFQLSVL